MVMDIAIAMAMNMVENGVDMEIVKERLGCVCFSENKEKGAFWFWLYIVDI